MGYGASGGLAEVCAGYGGLGLALGQSPVWYAEVDDGPKTVLAQAFPGVPNVGDITKAEWPRVPKPSVYAAGFPCQPISAGGLQRHRADERYLWPWVADGIRQTRPAAVFLENVDRIVSIDNGSVLAEVLGDLKAMGYAARWTVLGACAVGLAHHRHRWFCWAEHVGSSAPDAVRIPAKCGAPRSGGRVLLPTARARDWKTGSRHDELPVVACLLPTPRASDGAKGGPGQRGSKGDLALPAAVLSEVFGRYADAVALHAETTGRMPPAPTEPNRNGNMRLSPRFAEWLMDIPEGWVADHLTRVPALKAIGNGVVPRQARAALDLLRTPPVQLSLFDAA